MENNCFILNDITEDTFIKKNKDFIKTYGSVLDFFICDHILASKSECRVFDEELLKSDHRLILCYLNIKTNKNMKKNNNNIMNNKMNKNMEINKKPTITKT